MSRCATLYVAYGLSLLISMVTHENVYFNKKALERFLFFNNFLKESQLLWLVCGDATIISLTIYFLQFILIGTLNLP